MDVQKNWSDFVYQIISNFYAFKIKIFSLFV